MSTVLDQAMAALSAALEAETAALRTGDIAGAAGLVPAKSAAVDAFLAARTAAPRSAGPAGLQRLRRAVEANRAALEHGIGVQGRVIDAIARAAQPTDAMPGYARPLRPATAAVALSVTA